MESEKMGMTFRDSGRRERRDSIRRNGYGYVYCCKWCVSGRFRRPRKRYLARLQRRVNVVAIRNGVLDWLEPV